MCLSFVNERQESSERKYKERECLEVLEDRGALLRDFVGELQRETDAFAEVHQAARDARHARRAELVVRRHLLVGSARVDLYPFTTGLPV